VGEGGGGETSVEKSYVLLSESGNYFYRSEDESFLPSERRNRL